MPNRLHACAQAPWYVFPKFLTSSIIHSWQSTSWRCALEWIRSICSPRKQMHSLLDQPNGRSGYWLVISFCCLGIWPAVRLQTVQNSVSAHLHKCVSCLQYALAFLKHKPADACCRGNFHEVGCEAFVHAPDAFQLQGLPDNIKHAIVLQWYTTHSLSLQQQCKHQKSHGIAPAHVTCSTCYLSYGNSTPTHVTHLASGAI